MTTPAEVAQRVLDTLELRQVRNGLFLIKLADVDPYDEFHQQLVFALESCGPGASEGDLITAMRFTVGHAMEASGEAGARAKIGAEEMLAVGSAELMREGGVSRAAAERIVKDNPAYWDLKREAELMIYRERAQRELLKSLQAALDNHRTSRADQRMADQWHAQTAT